MFEVLDACVDVLGAGRVGLRLSPSSTYNSMSDSNSDATFGYVAERLNPYGLAFLDVVEPRITGNDSLDDHAPPVAAHQLRKHYTGTLLAAGGFTPDTAEAILQRGDADLVAFGRLFISNPDLPERIKLGLPLTPYDRSTFYGHEPRGYTDYPSYNDRSGTSD
jgi:N-ethylmaleimide reductase